MSNSRAAGVTPIFSVDKIICFLAAVAHISLPRIHTLSSGSMFHSDDGWLCSVLWSGWDLLHNGMYKATRHEQSHWKVRSTAGTLGRDKWDKYAVFKDVYENRVSSSGGRNRQNT